MLKIFIEKLKVLIQEMVLHKQVNALFHVLIMFIRVYKVWAVAHRQQGKQLTIYHFLLPFVPMAAYTSDYERGLLHIVQITFREVKVSPNLLKQFRVSYLSKLRVIATLRVENHGVTLFIADEAAVANLPFRILVHLEIVVAVLMLVPCQLRIVPLSGQDKLIEAAETTIHIHELLGVGHV
jgi:hypothetical protein